MLRMAHESIERPNEARLGIALQIFVGIAALPVGLLMMADPNGSPIGLPHEQIADSPFGSYLLPGIILFLVIGIGQLGGAALAILRHPLAPWLMGALGISLLVWIGVQVIYIPLSFLQAVIFAIGLIEGIVALRWLRLLGHLGGSMPR